MGPVAERGGTTYRSFLFVPGQKLDWMLKAPKYGADALLFDLEDAVPIEQKEAARIATAEAITQLKDAPFGRFVRVNGWRTGHGLRDVLATAIEGLDGICLAKTEGPEDVAALDLVLSELEAERGLPPGRIEIFPLTESAQAKFRTYDVIMASSRIKRGGLPINATPGGDGTRAFKLTLSRDGHEWIPIGVYTMVAARAAGITHIMGGLTSEITDVDLVRSVAVQSKGYGATGGLCIHPSHVSILNEVYAPSQEEIKHAREVLEAMATAIARGDSATRLGGGMVDYAHARSAQDLIAAAKSFDIPVGDVPTVELLSY
jgi:citrate lyase subunit beta/citryl-CoA lyase